MHKKEPIGNKQFNFQFLLTKKKKLSCWLKLTAKWIRMLKLWVNALLKKEIKSLNFMRAKINGTKLPNSMN